MNHIRAHKQTKALIPAPETVQRLPIILKKLSEPQRSATLASIAIDCYEMRKEEKEQILEYSKKDGDDFFILDHYIGRMGSTRHATLSIVKAMIVVPSLGAISRVEKVPHEEMRMSHVQFGHPYAMIEDIIGDLKAGPIRTKLAMRSLLQMEIESDLSFRDKIPAHTTITTRVHAELLLLDYFSRQQMPFLDDDRYIGCSKPACYFCYQWICNHPGNFVRPSTHHKIITGCRGPSKSINHSGVRIVSRIYEKICRQIGEDITVYLLSGHHRNQAQFMSTDGGSRATGPVLAGPRRMSVPLPRRGGMNSA
jgi:hypothetical protein